MKKISNILLIGLAAMSLSTLSSCKSGDGKTHVKFWHTMGQANQGLLNRMIAEFEAANPDIVIDAFSQGSYDDVADKIKEAIPSGTTPTMSFCYPDNVADYIEAGAVEELTSYIENSDYGIPDLADYNSSYWAEGTSYQIEGTYSVPYAKSTEVLFYNATVFEENNWEVPTTWDELWTLARQIKAKYPTVTPLGYDSDSNLFITLCEQYGIPYTTSHPADGESYYLFNNEQAKAMVEELKGYYNEGLFVTKGTSPNSSYTSTQFTNGKLVLSIGSTGGTTYNKSLNFNIGVAPLPAGSKNRHVVSQGPSICFFKRAKANEKVAAWKFYTHITNSVNTANYSISTGYEPVRTSSYSTDVYNAYIQTGGNINTAGTAFVNRLEEDNNLLATAAKCTSTFYPPEQYFTSPIFPGSDTARDAVGGIIPNVLRGTKTVDQAFTDALTQCVFRG
ncbi:MAG: extracellular solute-binding protein [Bacilli bacterium]